MKRFRGGSWGYILAIVTTATIVILLRVWLDDALGTESPRVLLLIPVVVASWCGGLKSGLVAVVLVFAAGVYFHVEYNGFYFPEPYDRARLFTFLLVGTLVSGLMEMAQAAERRLAARQSQLAEQEQRLAAETQNRRQVELALVEREERFRMAVESADIGTWELDVLTGQRRWSERSREMFGIESGQDVSKLSFLDLIHPDDRERTRAAIRAVLDPRGAGRYDVEYRIIRRDGALRWVVAKGQAFFEGQGNQRRTLRFVGTVLDITDRKEMEESLREADRRKDEFLAILAHELRNPIVPLQRALQVWSTIANEPVELAALRPMMHRQVQQINRLVDDLLDLARIRQGKFELRKQPVELASLISAAVETLEPVLEESGRRLRVELPDETITIDGDAARLTQVFGNLLHNAIKCTASSGTIDISATNEGDKARISVRDNGIGIPRAMLADIFGAFRQLETSQTGPKQGLGIGLHLVMRIVTMHGGGVEAHSDGLGRGSEFVVTLPMAPVEDQRCRRNHWRRARPRRAGRILIVDDVQSSAETLRWSCDRGDRKSRTPSMGPRRSKPCWPSGPTWCFSISACREWTATKSPGGCEYGPSWPAWCSWRRPAMEIARPAESRSKPDSTTI